MCVLCVQKIFPFLLFFLSMVIATAITFYMQLVTVVSYHFHVLTKKYIDTKPVKSWQEKIQR